MYKTGRIRCFARGRVRIAGLFAVFAGTLAYDKFIRKSPAPSFFGYSVLVIATGSMSGSIEAGDVVVVKDTGDYETGTSLHICRSARR